MGLARLVLLRIVWFVEPGRLIAIVSRVLPVRLILLITRTRALLVNCHLLCRRPLQCVSALT
jgi:hypothetical protein